jgi:hypothetical protein
MLHTCSSKMSMFRQLSLSTSPAGVVASGLVLICGLEDGATTTPAQMLHGCNAIKSFNQPGRAAGLVASGLVLIRGLEDGATTTPAQMLLTCSSNTSMFMQLSQLRPNQIAASQSPGLTPFRHSNENGAWPLGDVGPTPHDVPGASAAQTWPIRCLKHGMHGDRHGPALVLL